MKKLKLLIIAMFMLTQAVRAGGTTGFQKQPVEMSLEQVLNLALQENPIIKAADWQKVVSQKKVWEAKSSFLPSIQYVASYNWYEKPMIVVPIHEPMKFPPLDDRIFASQFQVRMPIFNGGQRLAAHKAAKADLQETGAQTRVVKSKVLQNVAVLFLQAKELNGKRDLIHSRLKALRERQRELSFLYKEGRVSEADFALLEANLQSVIADSLELAAAYFQLGNRLGQLVGVRYPILPKTEGTTPALPLDSDLYPDTTAVEERLNNPELEKARAQLEKARAMKALATRKFLPNVSGYYTHLINSSGYTWDPVDEWAVGVTIQIPLFDGGKRIANLGAAKAAEKAAQANLDNTFLEQQASLEIAFLKWDATRRRRQLLSSAVENKQKYVDANRKLYREGRISLSEILTQETELLALQIQEKELRYAEQQAILDYHVLIGDLSPELVLKIVR